MIWLYDDRILGNDRRGGAYPEAFGENSRPSAGGGVLFI
ncbi:hypothetical protein SPLC1_S060390 [Arthrospira platensis C1]|uniref:Uncharacterized protein n=1 Tax=Limnospira maxima CS-328 TaxID=513049 RepID=B5WA95_LIMMA|nr:hypothetical protein AmaxDRAFT_5695 [Limnospira maxima CS-328]EKD10668.1 hypothetical protein SPLC1_S060390 [Arthrospira platensis C1]